MDTENGVLEQPGGLQVGNENLIPRDKPEVDQGRRELVEEWCEKITKAKKHWGPKFDRMRRDVRFARGRQWDGAGEEDDRYVANITLRHINQRVASVYAKNPKVRAVRRKKLYATTWDGSQEMLDAAQFVLSAAQNPQMAAMAMMQGTAPKMNLSPEMAQAVMAEAMAAEQEKQLYSRMGQTLELVAQYSLDEPAPKFKPQLKQLVRRTLETSVGYLKLGYQRTMQFNSVDLEARIKDSTDQLAEIQRIMADLHDGDVEAHSAEAERLKLLIEELQQKKELVAREGLTFAFPKSWALIIDPCCTQLKGFVGAGWIAEEFIFTPKQVQKIFNVDIGTQYEAYKADGARDESGKKSDASYCAVYQVYDLVGLQCFTVCQGYVDFLKQPGEPDVFVEQFHPYYTLTFNDIEADEEDTIFPPSDVELMRPMAKEYNRGREGLRVHRQANRPGYVAAKGVFDDDAKTAFATHADHEIIEPNITKNDDINKLLKEKPTVKIDPALYDVEHVFVDTQRVLGDQAANLGGTSGSTATESSIAESSRVTSIGSQIDDLDDFLTDVLRGAGQVLLTEMSAQTVKEIAGPGAVWPELSREQVARELTLEIKAGSSGKPNRQARLQAIEKTAPFLLQIPGVRPTKLAEFMLQEIDEGIELEEFIDDKLPSITALNAMSKPNLAPMPGGMAQGPAGMMNAEQPGGTPGKAQNMNPGPGEVGTLTAP